MGFQAAKNVYGPIDIYSGMGGVPGWTGKFPSNGCTLNSTWVSAPIIMIISPMITSLHCFKMALAGPVRLMLCRVCARMCAVCVPVCVPYVCVPYGVTYVCDVV